MRILMINNEFPPLGGGMATANEELLKGLSRYDDVIIDLITAADNGNKGVEQIAKHQRIIRVNASRQSIHHATIFDLLKFMIASHRKARQLARVGPRYDLIMAWAAIPAGVTAAFLSRKLKIPYIVRTSGPEIPGFESRYKAIEWIIKPLLRWVLNGASTVIVKSSREMDLIKALTKKAEMVTIPNAAPASTRGRTSARTTVGKFTVLCVGRVIERKGQQYLLRALHELGREDIFLRIAGTGDNEIACRNLAKELGIESRVTFLGYVPREELNEEYTCADVMALPSENEGMSFAMLEALAAGLPVIATRGRGSDEIVQSDVNGLLVDWGSIEELASAIARLADNPELRSKMSEEALRDGATKNWNEIADLYRDQFCDAMA